MTLTATQIKIVTNFVDENKVTLPTLKDDVVDHLCCEIEVFMRDGKNFEEAFRQALYELAPHGLHDIQQQTELLLQPTKVIMKKILYFVGLASTISMTMGLMFKIMHMPGADQLINYGFFAFAFVFLPVIFARKLARASQLSTSEKLKAALGILSAVGLLLSIVFKMRMEINLATIFLFSTTIVFCFGFLPLQFYDLYRKEMRSAN